MLVVTATSLPGFGQEPPAGQTDNDFTQEFELGLSHRFQIADENNLDLDPSSTWKPSRRTRFDVAPLFGPTRASPLVTVFAASASGHR